MSISLTRIRVLSFFKMKELIKNKTFLITLIMVPGLTLAMRLRMRRLPAGICPRWLLGRCLTWVCFLI